MRQRIAKYRRGQSRQRHSVLADIPPQGLRSPSARRAGPWSGGLLLVLLIMAATQPVRGQFAQYQTPQPQPPFQPTAYTASPPRRTSAQQPERVLAPGQVRIKDVTTVEGDRVNYLQGLGLVTGLNGTGGKSPTTRQMAQNLLQNFGIRATPEQRNFILTDTRFKTDNISVVNVTMAMPVSARKGQRFSVKVAAFDDASSLLGGELLLTPLFGPDNVVYATAQGPVSLGGGFTFEADAANATKGHTTAGWVVRGAVIEEEVCGVPDRLGEYTLVLNDPNYSTAHAITEAINTRFPGVAVALDHSAVQVLIPHTYQLRETEFIGMIGAFTIRPDVLARVVINERTGTVIMGEHVRISKTALVHANLAVLTAESPQVSQPAPFSDGVTAVVPRSDINVVEEKKPVQVIESTVTVGDLAAALNALGVTPRDLSAVFQSLYASGHLHAHLELN